MLVLRTSNFQGCAKAQSIRLQHLHYYTSRVILKLNRNVDLAGAVDIMMARAMRIYMLMMEVKKLIFFFFDPVFPKRNRKHDLHISIEL